MLLRFNVLGKSPDKVSVKRRVRTGLLEGFSAGALRRAWKPMEGEDMPLTGRGQPTPFACALHKVLREVKLPKRLAGHPLVVGPVNPSCGQVSGYRDRETQMGGVFGGGSRKCRKVLRNRVKVQPAPKYHTKGCSRSSVDSPGSANIGFRSI